MKENNNESNANVKPKDPRDDTAKIHVEEHRTTSGSITDDGVRSKQVELVITDPATDEKFVLELNSLGADIDFNWVEDNYYDFYNQPIFSNYRHRNLESVDIRLSHLQRDEDTGNVYRYTHYPSSDQAPGTPALPGVTIKHNRRQA